MCERLADLYEEQGDAEQAERWRQQAEVESKGDSWLEPRWPEAAVTPSVIAGASHKLGRNETLLVRQRAEVQTLPLRC